MANGSNFNIPGWLQKVLGYALMLLVSGVISFYMSTNAAQAQQNVDHQTVQQLGEVQRNLQSRVGALEVQQATTTATLTSLTTDVGEVKRDVKELLRLVLTRGR